MKIEKYKELAKVVNDINGLITENKALRRIQEKRYNQLGMMLNRLKGLIIDIFDEK